MTAWSPNWPILLHRNDAGRLDARYVSPMVDSAPVGDHALASASLAYLTAVEDDLVRAKFADDGDNT